MEEAYPDFINLVYRGKDGHLLSMRGSEVTDGDRDVCELDPFDCNNEQETAELERQLQEHGLVTGVADQREIQYSDQSVSSDDNRSLDDPVAFQQSNHAAAPDAIHNLEIPDPGDFQNLYHGAGPGGNYNMSNLEPFQNPHYPHAPDVNQNMANQPAFQNQNYAPAPGFNQDMHNPGAFDNVFQAPIVGPNHTQWLNPHSGPVQFVNHGTIQNQVINMAAVHNVYHMGNAPPSKEQTTPCPYCPYKRDRKKSMERHVRDAHPELGRLAAQQVGKSCNRRQHCPVEGCNEERSGWDVLKKHVMKRHVSYYMVELDKELRAGKWEVPVPWEVLVAG